MINLKQTAPATTRSDRDVYNEHSPLILINHIARLELSRISVAGGCDLELNESARLVLFKISDNEGCTQQDIVRITQMKKPTVSVIVAKFEENGLIKKTVDEADRRAARITLTKKGKSTVSSLREFLTKEEQIAVDGLTVNECESLVKLLSKVRYNLAHSLEN